MTVKRNASVVSWHDRYSLDLPEMDSQHQALFRMINDLWQAIIDRSPPETLTAVLGRLESYTNMHFEAEEALMRSVAYPKLDDHRKTHQAFIKRVAHEKQKHVEGRTVGLSMLHFLNDWLVEHIMTVDKEYASYYERKQHSRSWISRLMPH